MIRSAIQIVITFIAVFTVVAALILLGAWRTDQTRPGTIVTPITSQVSR